MSWLPGFPEAFREELEAQLASPLVKPAARPSNAALCAPSYRFVRRSSPSATLQATFRNLPEQDFLAIVELLCDRRRGVYLLGGRFTDALARYFAAHLGLVRPGVRHVPSGIGVWRDRLLDISRRDVLIVFDIRRYQDDVITFARSATSRGAAIVLVTDQWLSPLSRQAAYVLPCRVAAPHAGTPASPCWRSSKP